MFSRAAEEYYSIFNPSLNKAYKIAERRKEINKILGVILLDIEENIYTRKGDEQDVKTSLGK